ncbi:MAG: energy transducer TonB [Ignavibacteria bacterium]|nr:energy transducer TonB [Ignavibacteria bacterium]
MNSKVYFKEHKHYSRNVKLGLIFSELIVIATFYFFPDLNSSYSINEITDPIILFEDVPITIQTNIPNIAKPELPLIMISEEIEETEILEDVAFKTESEFINTNDLAENTNTASIGIISMMPRQVLEVLPEKSSALIDGKISLYLKIDESGKVVEHKVLLNSVECDDCLKKVLSAAYQSRWDPAIRKGKQIECWVEKSYSFN